MQETYSVSSEKGIFPAICIKCIPVRGGAGGVNMDTPCISEAIKLQNNDYLFMHEYLILLKHEG